MASKPSVFAELIGIILSTYFGGRTDVKIRRSIRRVLLTDFLSLYSTIGAICGMWRFIVGNGFTLVDATNELTQLLDHITLDDLQEPDSWKKFNVLVQIEAHNDVLPVRAMYSPGSIMRTIGVNELEEGRLWYVAADIVGSTLRTGRRPKILKALRCVPGAIQEGLRPVHLAGSEVLFNPYKDDFFKFIIERRIAVKAKADEALRQGDTTYSMRLYAEFRRLSALVRSFDDAQMHLKVVANACYGFFIEMNANKSPKPVECDVYSYRGKESRSIWLSNVEEPGPYFHPLVGTMITAGARLMLMLCELLAEREGIDWMLCDTDSMLYAKPDEISDADFIDRVERIQQWFRPLNPYANADDILKFEGVNYRPGTTDFEPLYGLAIAPKSYVTFNLTEGEPIIREGKQFLLENYVTPYTRSETEERECRKTTKLRCWQRHVWLCVIRAFLAGRPDAVDLSTLPNFNLPAARRLSVSTTEVEKHLAAYNQGKPYRERIRPGGFLLSFTPKSEADREYLGYENSIDRASESDLSPVEEAHRLYECAWLQQAPYWESLREVGGKIVPDLAWDRNLRRWKRALEFADVPGRLLRANKNPKGQSAEIVYGNIDRVAQALRERTGNDDLSTTDVISFFVANPKPPRLRDFIARARERCYGWSNELRPLAPFDPDVAKAVKRCFNALGGRRVHRWELKTYADVFAGFHRRPEYKYDNGVGGASGQTLRRAVTPSRIDIISKETSRYAQQDQLAAFEPIQLASEGSLELLSSAVHRYGIGALARACGKSTDTVRRIVNGVQRFKADFVDSVLHFVETRAAEDREVELLLAHAKHIADREGLRCLAARLELQPSHLSEMLSGARPVSTKTRACLRRLPRPKAG